MCVCMSVIAIAAIPHVPLIKKTFFLNFRTNSFAELLPFWYISSRLFFKFEEQLRKNERRYVSNSFFFFTNELMMQRQKSAEKVV